MYGIVIFAEITFTNSEPNPCVTVIKIFIFWDFTSVTRNLLKFTLVVV
jgi:hypothetical protein